MSNTDALMLPTPTYGKRAGAEVEVERLKQEWHGVSAEAFRFYEGKAATRVPRRRCAADLLREKHLRGRRHG